MKSIIRILRCIRTHYQSVSLANKCRTRKPLKVLIGAGSTSHVGWISTDLPFLDATNTSDWYRLFGDRKISAICAEHVWEHMTEEQGANALKNASDFLETGGHIRLAVPDGNFPSVEYLEWVRPGGNGPGADDHKTLYNVYSLSKLGESVGLIPTPLEFFDSSGRFNFVEWQTQDGFIGRSSRFDVRNALGRLNYSSLIIDFRKPQFSK